jgi:polyferredoxin
MSGVVYGFFNLSPTEFNVSPQRQPLFVRLSDGSIQNKYTLKLLNKTNETMTINYVLKGIEGATLHGVPSDIVLEPGKLVPFTALVRVPKEQLTNPITPLTFRAEVADKERLSIQYKTVFSGPK